MNFPIRFLLLVFAILILFSEARGQGVSGSGLIGQWDEVEVRVFQEDDLTARGQLAADGTIGMPLIGTVRLAGLTTAQASAEIARRLRDGYLVNPQVTVTIQNRVRKTITIVGQVQNPGVFELPHHRQLTLVEAIGLAGGPTRIADSKSVTVKHADGRVSKHNFKALATGQATAPVILREGDIITVPESLF